MWSQSTEPEVRQENFSFLDGDDLGPPGSSRICPGAHIPSPEKGGNHAERSCESMGEGEFALPLTPRTLQANSLDAGDAPLDYSLDTEMLDVLVNEGSVEQHGTGSDSSRKATVVLTFQDWRKDSDEITCQFCKPCPYAVVGDAQGTMIMSTVPGNGSITPHCWTDTLGGSITERKKLSNYPLVEVLTELYKLEPTGFAEIILSHRLSEAFSGDDHSAVFLKDMLKIGPSWRLEHVMVGMEIAEYYPSKHKAKWMLTFHWNSSGKGGERLPEKLQRRSASPTRRSIDHIDENEASLNLVLTYQDWFWNSTTTCEFTRPPSDVYTPLGLQLGAMEIPKVSDYIEEDSTDETSEYDVQEYRHPYNNGKISAILGRRGIIDCTYDVTSHKLVQVLSDLYRHSGDDDDIVTQLARNLHRALRPSDAEGATTAEKFVEAMLKQNNPRLRSRPGHSRVVSSVKIQSYGRSFVFSAGAKWMLSFDFSWKEDTVW